jgi:hypothetical protein
MTREQIVRLHAGQMIRTKLTPGRYWMITKVMTSASGQRVLELESGRLFIGVDQVEEVLAA